MRHALLLSAIFIPSLAGILVACGSTGLVSQTGANDSGTPPQADGATSDAAPGEDGGAECVDSSPGSGVACIEAGGTCGSSGSLGQAIPTSSCGDPCFWSCWALSPVDASPDAADSSPPEDSGADDAEAGIVAEGGIVWTGPPPPPGMSSCEIYNPSLGGGCVCETVQSGHVYAVTCANDSASCACTIDGTPTIQIANLCEGDSTAFFQLCGFP
jgi:hypothetical protein